MIEGEALYTSNNQLLFFMMSFLKNRQLYFFFYFFLILLLVVPFQPIAALSYDPNDSLIYRDCTKNFTSNDLLQSNINNLVADMKTQVSLQRFAISSSGTGYNTVYGLARCQGDMSQEECSACISDAAEKIRSACPDSAEIRAWEEKCFLHYDISNFIGKVDQRYADVWTSYDEAENPKVFEQVVAEVMAEVMAAAVGDSWRFSSGQNLLGYGGGVTVYGMAQCTQDLGESECCQCLEASLEIMTKECGCDVGCRIFGSSCVLRYEIYKFISYGDGYALPLDPSSPAPSFSPSYSNFSSMEEHTSLNNSSQTTGVSFPLF